MKSGALAPDNWAEQFKYRSDPACSPVSEVAIALQIESQIPKFYCSLIQDRQGLSYHHNALIAICFWK
jgi:hypothetical protein